MRVFRNKSIFTKIFYSPFGAFIFLSIFGYFVYLNLKTIPFALEMNKRVEKTKDIYENNLIKKENQINKTKEIATEEAKVRYQKEFFNELAPDEYLIVLHSEKSGEGVYDETPVEMSLFSKYLQDISLWWKNL